MKEFIDRKNEMAFLESEYQNNTSSLVVVYGRRRVGKTSLISEFGRNKDMLYFLATEENEIQNKENFKEKIAVFCNNKLLQNATIQNWDDIFETFINYNSNSKKLLIIDEFQYLCKANSAFSSIFQRIWDTILKDKNIMVILCGSLINMMESQVLNYNSPLYGRRTGQIRLTQIPFKYYNEFFNTLDEKHLIELYSITGGVPKYIEMFNEYDDIFEAISKNILNKQSFLYEEPNFLLKNEVNEVGSYFSIIKTIAQGNHKLSKISTVLEIPQTGLSKYLQTLINLDILEREVPITEINPEKSKKGLYKIKDNFILFWFNFIYPNLSYIETNNSEVVLTKIKSNFIDNHVSYIYEQICREKAWDFNIANNLGYNKIGKWWNNTEEIDIVAINEDTKDILFGECKYTNKPIDIDILVELERKVKNVEWNSNNRKEKYILFSISGYTNRLKDVVNKRSDVILI